MDQRKIKIPSKLTLITIDEICPQLHTLKSGEKVLFDLSDVRFVAPDALLLLVTSSKFCFKKAQQPVEWVNADSEVRTYMDRMYINNLPFVHLEHPPLFQKRQYSKSDALIEVSTIASDKEIGNAIVHTKKILERWLSNGPHANLMNISTLFKETFENSIEHSGAGLSNGVCYYTLQKYTRGNITEIQIAVGDIGIGILGSQQRKYPGTKDDVDAIIQALKFGRSGRIDGEGGMGFANVRDALANLDGHLTIRSGRARVEYPHKKNIFRILRQEESYPGTQIFFKVRA